MTRRGFSARDLLLATATVAAVVIMYLLGLRSLPVPVLIGTSLLLAFVSMFREMPQDLRLVFGIAMLTTIALVTWVR